MGLYASGHLAAANSFMVAVPATRNSVLLPLLGVSFEQTIVLHRWLGYTVLLTSTLHVALTWAQWAASTPPMNVTSTMFGSATYTYGFVAWLCLLVMFLSALWFVRRRWFNLFQRVHYLFIAFYVLAGLHTATYGALRGRLVLFLGQSLTHSVVRGNLGRPARMCEAQIPTVRVRDGGFVWAGPSAAAGARLDDGGHGRGGAQGRAAPNR